MTGDSVSPSSGEVADFYRVVFGNMVGTTTIGLRQGPFRFIDLSDPDAIAQLVAAGHPDTYIRCNPLDPGSEVPAGKRGTATQTTTLWNLVIDLDVKPGGFDNQDQAVEFVYTWLNALPAPTALVRRPGGGVHAWWRLDEPVRGADAAVAVGAAWKAYWLWAVAQTFGGRVKLDPTPLSNPAGVLRCPQPGWEITVGQRAGQADVVDVLRGLEIQQNGYSRKTGPNTDDVPLGSYGSYERKVTDKYGLADLWESHSDHSAGDMAVLRRCRNKNIDTASRWAIVDHLRGDKKAHRLDYRLRTERYLDQQDANLEYWFAAPPVDDTPESKWFTLSEGFWAKRPSLQQVADAAISRRAGPDAVLGNVLTRLTAFSPPTYRLCTGIGVCSTTNLYVLVVAKSGRGKGAAQQVAEILVPTPAAPGIVKPDPKLASGEGFLESYQGYVKAPVEWDDDGKPTAFKMKKAQVFNRAAMTVDEASTFVALASRVGSTLTSVLLSAWSGSTLGNNGASNDTTRSVQNYNFGLTVGIQPALASTWLDQAGTGLPQRFLWLTPISAPWAMARRPTWDEVHPSEDLFDTVPSTAPQTDLTEFRTVTSCHTGAAVEIDSQVRRVLWQDVDDRDAGLVDTDELDSHGLLLRLRVAYGLALLDNRPGSDPRVTLEDWELAGEIMEVSNANRAVCVASVAADRKAKDTAQNRLAVELADAVSAPGRALTAIRRRQAKVGRPLTRQEARECLSSKLRRVLGQDLIDVLDQAEAEGTAVPGA